MRKRDREKLERLASEAVAIGNQCRALDEAIKLLEDRQWELVQRRLTLVAEFKKLDAELKAGESARTAK